MSDPRYSLLTANTPLLDVRAPVEFAQGALPGAVNLPIMNDAEREQVGICYKEQGPEAAVALGHTLVTGPIKAERVAAWQEFIRANPGARIYCFRGGQRSRIAAQWLSEAGTPVPRIEGGYKALRTYLLSVFTDLPPIVVLGGKTGCGKTLLLNELQRQIDLEGHAQHRGSAFGRQVEEQPAQIDFENAVALDFLRLRGPDGINHESIGDVVIEDEARMIGRVNLPVPLQEAMKTAPLVMLDDTVENRVARIFDEYIVNQFSQLRAISTSEDQAHRRHCEGFLIAIDAIRKRLGGARHQRLAAQLSAAFAAQRKGDLSLHREWIGQLLVDYYDPMYEYQIQSKLPRLVFRGNYAEALAYLRSREVSRQAG